METSMTPLKTSLFILYCAVSVALLGLAFSTVWSDYKRLQETTDNPLVAAVAPSTSVHRDG